MYALLRKADEKGCTVTKLLTGEDRPLLNLEMTLYNTYNIVTRRLEQQQSKKGKRR